MLLMLRIRRMFAVFAFAERRRAPDAAPLFCAAAAPRATPLSLMPSLMVCRYCHLFHAAPRQRARCAPNAARVTPMRATLPPDSARAKRSGARCVAAAIIFILFSIFITIFAIIFIIFRHFFHYAISLSLR
jgi:hypothetical protein